MQQGIIHSRSRLRLGLIIAGVAVLGVAVVLAVFLAFLSPLSRRWLVKVLGEHYHCDVRLQSFQLSLIPRITVTGTGLMMRYKDQPSARPLASIREFSMETTWIGLLRHPSHVREVTLRGLTINIPPRPQKAGQRPQRPTEKTKHRLPPFYLEHMIADGTALEILSSKPQKPPRVFAISKLQLRSVAEGQAMSFQATLTNPKPIGQIYTAGKFGPWDPDEPGQTPVSGNYAFTDADLSTIRGLSGILSSRGKYNGELDFISVQGESDTPQFGLGISSNRMDLKTQFRVVVDGVNGDTLLRPVKAQLGQSVIMASGGILRTTGMTGETVSLAVSADQAQLADLLDLAVKSSTPPMVGTVSLHTQFDLLPGSADITRRLKLNGNFAIQSARFTDPEVEQKMTHLSQRGEGRPGRDDPVEPAVLHLHGYFVLSSAVMSFSDLSFGVPGAAVNLDGTYGLLDEDLNFQGDLRLKAKLSQTTTGVKSFLLRALNPLFKGKGAGTVVPIKIKGTRQHPAFRIRFGKLLSRNK